MKLRFFAAAAAAFGLMTTAAGFAQATAPEANLPKAEVGLYLNPIAIHATNSTLDSSSYAFLGLNDTARTFWGVNFGGYYDFAPVAHGLAVGVDVRDSDLHANNASLKEFFLGLRVSDQNFAHNLKPYLQASVGLGSTKAPTSIIHVSKVDYRIYGGLDYRVQRHIDLRVVEVGYGTVKTISSGTVGGGGDVAFPGTGMLSISTGLVFRFP